MGSSTVRPWLKPAAVRDDFAREVLRAANIRKAAHARIFIVGAELIILEVKTRRSSFVHCVPLESN